jgi:hypothetical protein
MNKTFVVVSTYVDSIIKEQQPDVKFLIFNTLQELSAYIETTPIRANTLYITSETLQPMVNTALNFLMGMLSNPFLSIDKVEYITEKGSKEIISVKYITEELGLTNWNIIPGSLTREFISGLISGTLRSDEIAPTRKAVFRQRRSDYVADRMSNKKSLDEKYLSDEEDLADIPDEQLIPITPMEIEESCKVITIAGLPMQERTVFSFVMAQYLAHSGKTLIIEKDFEYLTLSDMAVKANITFVRVDIAELYRNAKDVFRFLRNTNERLIVVSCHQKSDYNYSFVCNLMYNNLANILSYMVVESDLHEVATSTDYIAVLPNNIVDIIKTSELLPDNYRSNASFVGVNMRNVKEVSILNSEAMTLIVKDLLQIAEEMTVPVVNIRSLKLGGEAHDLRMLIKDR